MKNTKGLISLADRPKEERIKIARLGGLASGKRRRRKRDLRMRLQILSSEYETTQGVMSGFEIVEKYEKGEIEKSEIFFEDYDD